MNFFLLTQSRLIFIPFRIRAAWVRIRNYFFRIQIRIRPKVSDPTGSGSGSTTLKKIVDLDSGSQLNTDPTVFEETTYRQEHL